MNIENLSLVVDNINYLNKINCNFEFNKIYALVGDTSVNVFLRVLCNLIKPTLGSIKITDNTNLVFFLNDMHFINDFDAIETLEDISTTKLDKKEISVLLNKVDLLKDSKLEIKNYSENMLKKLVNDIKGGKKNEFVLQKYQRRQRKGYCITGNFKGSCGRRWFIRTGADSGIG